MTQLHLRSARGQVPLAGTGVIENESSSVSETGGSSPSADIAVSDQSSGSAMESNTLQTPEANSLSAADSSTESITSASAENPNAVVKPISCSRPPMSDGQTVTLGDVSNSDGTSAKFLPLDKTSYEAGDSAQITLQDSSANVDHNSVNTVQVFVGSKSDDPSGQFITLTETKPTRAYSQGLLLCQVINPRIMHSTTQDIHVLSRVLTV